MCAYLMDILKNFLDCRYIASLASLYHKELILVHARSRYTEVSYQGRWKIKMWGEMDQNAIFALY